MKHVCELCVKNISNKIYEKERNCLFKMKRTKLVLLLEKWSFTSIKRSLCFTKGHLNIPKGEVEVKSPPNQKLIWTFSIQIKKKKHFF